MSVKKRISNLYTKLYLFNINLMTKQSNDEGVAMSEPENVSKLVLNEHSLKEVHSNTYKNHFQVTFEEQLNQNMPHFTKAATSYFSNLILLGAIQSKHGDPVNPKTLELFETLEDMFPLVTLVDTPKDGTTTEDFATVDKLTLEGVLRWFSDTYVKSQFEYMLLEEVKEVALIDHILFHETNRPPLRQLAIKALMDSIGEVYFIRLRASMVNTLRDKVPTDLFKAGEFEARVMANSHSKSMEDMDKENKELLESISRVNSLWLRVITNYESLFKEKFPKGRITEEVYDSKLVLVLLNLKKEGITLEEIQELNTLDNKLELQVRRKIASFTQVRG